MTRKPIKKIIQTLFVCCSQNIPLRGHDYSGNLNVLEDKMKPSDKGNFKAFLGLLASSDETLLNFLTDSPRNAQYIPR